MRHRLLGLSLGLAVIFSTLGAAVSAQTAGQFMPVTIYRTGAMAGFGTPPMVAYMDYMEMLNKRDGGINGVKLVWEECENAYQPDRMVECYERLKNRHGGATAWVPYGTGLSYAILDRATADKVPVVMIGNGRTDASDGRIFPYGFPLVSNIWSQETSIVRFIEARAGGGDSLKGKKIVNLYHDSAYGKETIPILDQQAREKGFEIQHMPVALPGIDQKAVWLQIRRSQPDWVILQGAGLVTQNALKEAAGIAFPRDRIVGNYWSGAEEDTIPAGAAAKGYIAAALHGSGTEFPVVQDILKYVYDQNAGNGPRSDVGSVRYIRGLVHGIILMEGVRVAQQKFGEGEPITGEQMQYGLENLDFTTERLTELGASEMMPLFSTSCADHEGGAPVRFTQWDGENWQLIGSWVESDQAAVRPMIEASAATYAKQKGITPRDCN